MKLYKLHGIAGSGKTDIITKLAHKRLSANQKTFISSPRRKLLDQTRARLIALGVDPKHITVIYSKRGNRNSVCKQLMDHLKAAKTGVGEILLCTHRSFLSIPEWQCREQWCAVIDEVPSCMIADHSKELPQNFAFLTDYLMPEDASLEYSRVIPRDEAARLLLASRVEHALSDIQNKLYKELLEALLDPHQDVFCNVPNWNAVTAGMSPNETAEIKKKRAKLHFHSVMLPSILNGFDEPVIAAAQIDDHLFYHIWSQLGVEFVPATHLENEFGSISHLVHDGSRLTINLLTGPNTNRLFSNTYSNTLLSDGRTPREALKEYCEMHLAAGSYLFITNAQPDDNEVPDGAVVLGPHPHGLNNYRHFETVVISSALVPDQQHEKFLRSLGATKQDIYRDIAALPAYQGLMRSALRMLDSDIHVTLYITNPDSAAYIAALFPGCTFNNLTVFAEPLPRQKPGPKPTEKTKEQLRKERNERDRRRYAAKNQKTTQGVTQ